MKLFLVTVALTFMVSSASSFADEGMWVYNNLPKKQLKEKYAFEPTAEWAEHLMKSSVRFNSGGSGSIISSSGLVLTNHHVGADTLNKISTSEKNYYRDGFYAKTHAEEVPAKDLEINQLVAITDVTDRVIGAVKPEMTADQALAAKKAMSAQIEKEGFEATKLRSDVVTLYQGGQYHLYQYEKYTDVRLVFAPEFAMAFFGGDPDNFEYPRYDLDMCVFRIYRDGKPVNANQFLKWKDAGATDGELVFVSGHPGSTKRLFTVAALELLRDLKVPYIVKYLKMREVELQQFSVRGAEQARVAKGELFSIQNSRKVYAGRLKGLQEPEFMRAKQQSEYELRAAVEAKEELKELSSGWDLVTQAQRAAEKLYVDRSLFEAGQGFNSTLFSIARTLVRMADEDAKPNNERLPEFRDSSRASLLQTLYSEAPISGEFEQAKLADGLSYLSQVYGENSERAQLALRGRDPQGLAAEIIDKTTLKSVAVRRLIARGGKAAIEGSYDPMIQLAKRVDEASRQIRKAAEDSIDALETAGYAKVAKAVFQTQGTAQYPDATFTLRLSYGQVKGYEQNGKQISPFTTMGGAFDHEKAHGAEAPYQIPKTWHDAKGNLDLSTPLNFVATTDIIGGNSGSPVLNREGELVGLIFDGNQQSLTSDYGYTDTQNRAVSVHAGAMREALRKIYSASALADEIGK
ncbi:MAG: S46 family peptidase [Deltaproteobacteria bacterium]|nr:S46 family peptidase [Deltaproteobacteria bacterium]